MFQREVAQRIVAKPDTPEYGRLSVLSQWRSSPQLALPVHRSAFTPPPKVMSAVVHIRPVDAPSSVDSGVMERLTGAAFGQRRKMLRQSLKGLDGGIDALSVTGIDGARRAETLSIDEFVAIARQLTQLFASR
jgi:16S rRNA (adenine1518-N6/adenine1519-N6)-dimethyltransferase